jgi:hypothetical protein
MGCLPKGANFDNIDARDMSQLELRIFCKLCKISKTHIAHFFRLELKPIVKIG